MAVYFLSVTTICMISNVFFWEQIAREFNFIEYYILSYCFKKERPSPSPKKHSVLLKNCMSSANISILKKFL